MASWRTRPWQGPPTPAGGRAPTRPSRFSELAARTPVVASPCIWSMSSPKSELNSAFAITRRVIWTMDLSMSITTRPSSRSRASRSCVIAWIGTHIEAKNLVEPALGEERVETAAVGGPRVAFVGEQVETRGLADRLLLRGLDVVKTTSVEHLVGVVGVSQCDVAAGPEPEADDSLLRDAASTPGPGAGRRPGSASSSGPCSGGCWGRR